jgi:hypothetical protein
MITCDLRGGLGNQLFQILAILSLSKRHNVPFCFTSKECLDGDTSVLRKTFWYTLLKDLQPYTTNLDDETWIHVSMEQFPYQPMEYNEDWRDKKVMYQGYFQSYRYFQDNETEVLRDLVGLDRRKKECKEAYPLILNKMQEYKTTISMHFRLGDYKDKQYFHPIMTKEYYRKALENLLASLSTDDTILVMYFCEEGDNSMVIPTVFELSILFPQCVFYKCPDKMEDYNQMMCMSFCDHHIIANSSFSWFGAYLNPVPEKKVCYPSVWFCGCGSDIPTQDLFPGHWIKVDA